jgi:hypothetical protein
MGMSQSPLIRPPSADTFSQREKGISPRPQGEGASKRRVREIGLDTIRCRNAERSQNIATFVPGLNRRERSILLASNRFS